jgi:stage III sporulation protein AH
MKKARTKKLNFIIGKKQIILSCLTLILAVSVYANYALSGPDKKDVIPQEKSGGDTYGQADYVNKAEDGADTFFAQARLDKQADRDEAIETLQATLGGGDLSDDERVVNALDATEVAKLVEAEGEIETLIKANGFKDCVVYLDKDAAKVVVKTDGLDAAGAATIKDIILGEITVPTENIRIFEVK